MMMDVARSPSRAPRCAVFFGLALVACTASSSPAATGDDDDDSGDTTTALDSSSSETPGSETSDRVVPVDLVFADGWSADPSLDPAPDHAPSPVTCAVGFGDELGVFEVDTGLCNYGVFSQPAATEIFEGERVELTFTHDDLLAPEPAMAHVAVAIAGTIVYSTEVAIPKAYEIGRAHV